MPNTTLTNPTLKKLAAEQNTSLSQVTLEYQESEKGMRIYKQVVRVEIN